MREGGCRCVNVCEGTALSVVDWGTYGGGVGGMLRRTLISLCRQERETVRVE